MVLDRTQEFKSCVSVAARSSQSTVANKQNQMQRRGSEQSATTSQKSEFSKRASAIAQQIAGVTELLQKLAVMARRKALFDDRPVEFNELTFVIKQRLSQINDSIAGLQHFQQQQKSKNGAWGGNKNAGQLNEHSDNVVVMLQNRLSDTTTGFTEVLEERSQNIQQSKSRTEQFMSSVRDGNSLAASSDSPLYNTGSTNSPNPYNNAALQQEQQSNNPYGNPEYLALPNEQQQVLLEEQQDQYLSQRANAVEAIESTIQELGGIFSQLATMVAEQRDTVQRIDANTEDISMNVSGAQRELLKYYARISSNRWLMVKMFGVILFFFFIWVLVS